MTAISRITKLRNEFRTVNRKNFKEFIEKKKQVILAQAHEKGMTRRGFEPLPADADEKPDLSR